jgi:hypothetical protein
MDGTAASDMFGRIGAELEGLAISAIAVGVCTVATGTGIG